MRRGRGRVGRGYEVRFLRPLLDEAVMVEATPSSSFHKCGGRCGDPKCAALFISIEDLTKHIDAIKMPQCRHVSWADVV